MPTSSVWLRPDRPPRDRRLDRAELVRRAVAILDAEGRAGLSMRRVAGELGVTAGALYWYVATKDELLELAFDDVLGEVLAETGAAAEARRPADGGGGEWRERVAALASALRGMLLRHPWALTDLVGQPNLGPNAFALAEAGLEALSAAGFAGADLDAALAAVNDHVVGAATAEVAWRAALERSGRWRDEAAADYLRRATERHPLLARRMAADTSAGLDVDRECDRRFAFGLGCVLDGLAARLTAE